MFDRVTLGANVKISYDPMSLGYYINLFGFFNSDRGDFHTGVNIQTYFLDRKWLWDMSYGLFIDATSQRPHLW